MGVPHTGGIVQDWEDCGLVKITEALGVREMEISIQAAQQALVNSVWGDTIPW